MNTELTRRLGIDVPVLQGGMAWVSGPELAAAVSAAGGLGIIGAATMECDELRDAIRRVRARTDRPFGVNIPLILVRPDGEDRIGQLIEIVLAERVPVVITGAGSATRLTSLLRGAGRVVGHVVPSPDLAVKAYRAGVDFVIAESVEAGGHVREGGLATMSLVPQVVDAVPIPVVAAGGIADGRGMAAALTLGASAVQLGTRFIATKECSAHPAYKGSVIRACAEQTGLYGPRGQVSRGLLTPPVERMIEMAAAGADDELIREERGQDRARRGCVDGEVEAGILPSGSAVGLVQGLPSVAALLDELVSDAQRSLRASRRLLDARGGSMEVHAAAMAIGSLTGNAYTGA
jgi:enoyl-[acyl-carrier protein] reductase II